MKILILSGTPKKDGITHSMVTAAFETARTHGAEAEIAALSELGIKNCRMCGDGWGLCSEEYRCAFGDEDGFNELQIKMEEANAFIYITPVYWGEISEIFKAFLDRLRRCQASKQWGREKRKSFLNGKPSILVANAGGGGGGILTALQDIERAVSHMGGDSWPRETSGIFDYIGVNRWNQDFKREALKASVREMIKQNEKNSH